MKFSAAGVDLHWKKPNNSEFPENRYSGSCTDYRVSLTYFRSFSTLRPFGYSCTQLSLSANASPYLAVYINLLCIFSTSVLLSECSSVQNYIPHIATGKTHFFRTRIKLLLRMRHDAVILRKLNLCATSQFTAHSLVIAETKCVYCAVRTASTSRCQCHSTIAPHTSSLHVVLTREENVQSLGTFHETKLW